MSLIDWALICGTGILIKSSAKKEREQSAIAENEYEHLKKEWEKENAEAKRRRKVNQIRESSFIYFREGISKEDFNKLANETAQSIKRINKVEIYGAKVYCTVSSQTGYSDWEFSVDFNNWGHITGVYWSYTDNYDSTIPNRFGQTLSGKIQNLLEEKGITLNDFSDVIDENKFLCNGKLSYHAKESIINKHIKKKYKSHIIGYNYNDLIGEHVFSVVSIFRNKGFKDIYVLAADLATHDNGKDEYEVFKITINGSESLKSSISYSENSEIKIYYYGKKTIKLLKESNNYKGRNHNDIYNELLNIGFINIYENKIKDIINGLIIKEGAVQKITIGKNKELLQKNKKYEYDDKIIIHYHTKK